MTLQTTLEHLKWCSDALADVDCMEMFFPAINATHKVLEVFLPKPYACCTPVPISNGELWRLFDALSRLEKCEISIASFLACHLEPLIVAVDRSLYREMAVTAYNAATAQLLLALATKEDALYSESPNCKAKAEVEVELATARVWQAFSALPLDEQKKLLPPPPTQGD